MLEMVLKTLIAVLDIKIDPAQVKDAFEQAKKLVPEIATKMQEIDARSIRIENMLLEMRARKESTENAIELVQ